MSETPFPVLYEDASYIAINKPGGILVHRTSISEDTRFVLQLLRDQIGQRIYPIHRLDRATSGVLIFGKDKAAAGLLAAQFREKRVEKIYYAIIRGYVEESARIDYPISSERAKRAQEAVTYYRRVQQVELPFAVNRYPSSRYSLVRIQPETGRWRQIRKHFSHLRHPIIGDKKHGDIKHNKYFAQQWGIHHLLLHAYALQFQHPVLEENCRICAPFSEDFQKAMEVLKFPEIDLK